MTVMLFFLSVMFIATFCLLIDSTPAEAYGLTQCAADRYGSDLGCTANDVSITGIAIVPGGPTSCVGGQTLSLDLDVSLNFAMPNRWDIGVFLAGDGKDPSVTAANGGSSLCTVSVLPLTSPFLNLDGDGCGDGNGGINGGTGQGVLRVTGVTVLCQAVNLSGGKLYIPYLTSWDNQSTPPGAVCNTAADPAPNTGSKCNVPKSTVLADVLRSTVEIVALPTISKSDGIATITAGNSTSYSVVITNTTGAALNNAIFRDAAVANLTVNGLTCVASGGATCPPSLSISAMQGGGITIPSMPADSSLTFTISSTVSDAAPAGTITNTASVTVNGESNTASDTNTVIKKFGVNKAFAPSSIAVNGESILTITLRNDNLLAATGVAFTDVYPLNLVNAALPDVTNSCGGTVTAAGGGASLILGGATIPAGGSCAVTVKVTSATGGAYLNSTGSITSNEGFVGDSASASLAVGVANLSTSAKSYVDLNGGDPDPGDTIRYTITLTETAGVGAVGASVTDNIPPNTTGFTVNTTPPGSTNSSTGAGTGANGTGYLNITNITVPASSSVTIVFDVTISGGTPAGTSINNCASVANPAGIGASPCASTIIVSPSMVASSGNKPLYLYDGTSSPAYKLSRTRPSGAPASVTVAKSSSRQWTLGPALQKAVTISPNVTPLAIIPVNLYLASNTANESRTVQVDVTCSGGGATYSETKIFDGTAVNNPYLPTSPILVPFTNLTISANHTCAAGQTWNLTVRNTTSGAGTRDVVVYPVSGGNYSYLSLPSLSVINVDSVSSYSAAYPAVTTPPSGFYEGGQTVYVRAIVSDPFGSFDIASATVTIRNAYSVPTVTAAMTAVADSGTSTKTFEYAYVVPTAGPEGSWTAVVTAREGVENLVTDSGTGFFSVGIPNLLIAKSVQVFADPHNGSVNPKAIPGATMQYAVLVTNTGRGTAQSVVVSDAVPANTVLFVGDLGGVGSGPVGFSDGAMPSGLTYSFGGLANLLDNVGFSNDNGATYTYVPVPDADGLDAGVTNVRISLSGTFNGASGGNNPSFGLTFRVKVK